MKNRLIFCRKRSILLYLLGLCTFVIFSLLIIWPMREMEFHSSNIIVETTQHNLFSDHNMGIQRSSKCELPYLPVDNPEIMKYIINVDRITCGDTEKDWVVNNGTHAYITEEAKKMFKGISCKFIELRREDDFMTRENGKITLGENFKFENSDFVRVQCSVPEVSKTWESYFASPRAKLNLPITQSTKSDKNVQHNSQYPLNVLMWGHDSLSRNMFVRKLPKTYDYLKNSLNGITLEGYNIVGDGTPQALIPILTGKTERELPETRKIKRKANTVDVYPFIWKQFHENGYLTGFMEDQPHIGTFQFRLKGFNKVPTDYYMRPYFLAVQPHLSKYKDYCIGSVPRHKVVMNYVKNIFLQKMEIPKFVFSFYNELSHGEANLIQGADEDLYELLNDFNSSNILNQTILILMSDHGHRFAAFRETLQGKQEERKPIIMFIFPKWFEKVYPRAYKNFLMNTNRLSTPFDLHETLLDTLKLPDLPHTYFEEMNPLKYRSLSLFKEISSSRSCSDAGIESHWCTCLHWNVINSNETIIQNVAEEFVKLLNDLTGSHRNICAELKLSQVLWSVNSYPKDELLQFKKSQDADGIIPDMSDSTVVAYTVLQIQLETLPGRGHYEFSTLYNIKNKYFKIEETDISRTNEYGAQASCVEKELEHLRKYCFCS